LNDLGTVNGELEEKLLQLNRNYNQSKTHIAGYRSYIVKLQDQIEAANRKSCEFDQSAALKDLDDNEEVVTNHLASLSESSQGINMPNSSSGNALANGQRITENNSLRAKPIQNNKRMMTLNMIRN